MELPLLEPTQGDGAEDFLLSGADATVADDLGYSLHEEGEVEIPDESPELSPTSSVPDGADKVADKGKPSKPPMSDRTMHRILLIGGGAILSLLLVWGGSTFYVNQRADLPEAPRYEGVNAGQVSPSPQQRQRKEAKLEWPDDPPPADFPLPIAGGENREYNFESEEAAVRLWLPATVRDWSVNGASCFGAIVDERRVFSISWVDLYTWEKVEKELPKIANSLRSKEEALEASFLLWGRYPAIAREDRFYQSGRRLSLTFVRNRRVFHLRAPIAEFGDRPEDVVRFFNSFRWIDDEVTAPSNESLPPCEKPIAAVDTSQGKESLANACGQKHGVGFDTRAPEGGRLVGLVVEESVKGEEKRIRSLQPIYQVDNTYHVGNRCGGSKIDPEAKLVRHTLLAEPGDAVLGFRLALNSDRAVSGLTVMYVPVDASGSPDLNSAYASNWIGQQSLDPVTIVGSLGPVVGLHGFVTEAINAIGVITWNR